MTLTQIDGKQIKPNTVSEDLLLAANGPTLDQFLAWNGSTFEWRTVSATPTEHNHDDLYYTESETDTLLAGKSDAGHTHDDRYVLKDAVIATPRVDLMNGAVAIGKIGHAPAYANHMEISAPAYYGVANAYNILLNGNGDLNLNARSDARIYLKNDTNVKMYISSAGVISEAGHYFKSFINKFDGVTWRTGHIFVPLANEYKLWNGATLDTSGAWWGFDSGASVPENAVAIAMRISGYSDTAGATLLFAKAATADNAEISLVLRAQVPQVHMDQNGIVTLIGGGNDFYYKTSHPFHYVYARIYGYFL